MSPQCLTISSPHILLPNIGCSPFRISPTLLTSSLQYFSIAMLSIVVEPSLSSLAADCLYSIYYRPNKVSQQLKEFNDPRTVCLGSEFPVVFIQKRYFLYSSLTNFPMSSIGYQTISSSIYSVTKYMEPTVSDPLESYSTRLLIYVFLIYYTFDSR